MPTPAMADNKYGIFIHTNKLDRINDKKHLHRISKWVLSFININIFCSAEALTL